MGENKIIKPQDYYDIYEDEIDLYELWLRLKKRWKIITGTVLIFITLCVIYMFTAQPVYEGKFTVKLPSYMDNSFKVILFFSTEEVKKEISKLNDLIRLRKYNELSSKLNLEIDKAVKIVSINTHTIRGLKDTVEIKVETTDPTIIKLISLKIITYLNNNKYVKEFIKTKKAQLKEEIKEIEKSIQALRGTKRLIEKLINEGKAIYFNPAEIDKAIQSFSSKLSTLRVQLKTLRGFEISVEPETPSKPAKPKKALIFSISFVSSIFLGIFLALFLEWLEEAKKRHSANPEKNT